MKSLILTVLIVSTLALGACNTLQGVGQDIKTGGQKLEKAVEG